MSIYKGLRYYKYVYEDWTQPVLTANGTMGGESFAVSASSIYDGNYQPSNVFDENLTNEWEPVNSGGLPAYIEFYNPKKLKVSKLTITNGNQFYVTKCIFQGSNDYSDWVDIKEIVNTVGTLESWSADVNSDIGYKYHRLYITETSNGLYCDIRGINITAQEQHIIESTKDDYDYAVPIKIKDSGRGVFIGSKNTNCLTYTPKHVDVELNPLNANVTGTWGVIADGVAKGFTTANYLTLPEVFNPESNPWEVVVKFTTGTNVTTEAMLLSANGNAYRHVHLFIKDSKLSVSLSSNGSSWNLGTIQSTNFLEVNKTYYAKVNFTGSDYNMYYSLDGDDYNLIGTITNSTPIYANPLTQSIGLNKHSSGAGSPFLGSIDLSQSYININGERWWSGDSYTKVGSWIDNGVVGSFTSANYLTVPEVLPSSITSSEYVFKITTGASVTSPENQIISAHKSPNTGVIVIRGSKFHLFTGSWNGGVTTVLPNTTYILKTVFDGSSWTLYSSTDNTDWTQEVTWTTTNSYAGTNLYIGRDYDTTGEYFTGTIDLTQSYIKINDEIWWQGGTGDVTLKAGGKVFVPNGWSDYDYYKYVYQDWTQPVLTANGTMGGESFAVGQSSSYSSNDFWKLFAATPSQWHSGKGLPQWVSWYNPNPLKVTKLFFKGHGSGNIGNGIIQACDDNESWVDVVSFSNTNSTGDFEIDLSSNGTHYKYWRIYITSCYYNASGYYPLIAAGFNITAQEVIGTELSTPDDYDYKVGVNKVFNELVIPSDISAQSFANSEQIVCYNPETNRLCFVGNDVYDTDNNVMSDNISFPVAICTADNVSVTSIDETFDWCGRIGNTAFVLPDVKGFIANGIKDTGTYNSTEFTVNKVLTSDLDVVTDRSLLLSSDKLDYVESTYNKKDNLLYNTDGEVINAVECGKVTSDGTAITSLIPYTAQPETTGIPVNAIYNGSQLVYQYKQPGEVLFEQSTAGTYTFTSPYNCTVDVVLVGGGGGGSNSWGGNGRTGGSAGMVTGSIAITRGTTYTIVVGGGGAYGYGSNVEQPGRGATGGTTSAFGNDAYGGAGGYTHTGWGAVNAYNGAGGSFSVVSGFTGSNGVAGSTANRYDNYGGGGAGSANGSGGYVMITVKG
jgi:hypothetical protein